MNGNIYYFEEVEINDYPQKARYALNNRTEMERIQDWTGAAIGIRGNYVPPGKKPALKKAAPLHRGGFAGEGDAREGGVSELPGECDQGTDLRYGHDQGVHVVVVVSSLLCLL